MARYEVLTDHCTLADKGDTVDLDDTPAVAALVDAGHLRVTDPKPSTKPTRKTK